MVTAWLNIRFCPRKPVLTEWVRVLTSSCSILGAATTGFRTGRKWLPLTPATVECIYKRNNKRRQVFSRKCFSLYCILFVYIDVDMWAYVHDLETIYRQCTCIVSTLCTGLLVSTNNETN